MDTLYYEDYTDTWQMQTTARSISEYDIMQFVTLVGLREPLFLDMEYLKNETQFQFIDMSDHELGKA